MKVTAKQTVTRLLCWFDPEELTTLRATGQSPSEDGIWLTTEEVVAVLRLLYGDTVVDDMMVALRQQIERFS